MFVDVLFFSVVAIFMLFCMSEIGKAVYFFLVERWKKGKIKDLCNLQPPKTGKIDF